MENPIFFASPVNHNGPAIPVCQPSYSSIPICLLPTCLSFWRDWDTHLFLGLNKVGEARLLMAPCITLLRAACVGTVNSGSELPFPIIFSLLHFSRKVDNLFIISFSDGLSAGVTLQQDVMQLESMESFMKNSNDRRICECSCPINLRAY